MTDKWALVTGGGRRLGRLMSEHLAACGYNIILHYRNFPDKAQEAAAAIAGHNRRCKLFQADLAVASELETFLAEIKPLLNHSSLLINNASAWYPRHFLESTPEDFDLNFGIHVRAPYFISRLFAQEASGGQIINILDAAVAKNQVKFFPYLLSKKCLLAFTEMAALALAPKFRVNAMAPRAVTPPNEDVADLITMNYTDNPLEKKCEPEDLITGLDYLLSAPQVTGQCIYLDAGWFLN